MHVIYPIMVVSRRCIPKGCKFPTLSHFPNTILSFVLLLLLGAGKKVKTYWTIILQKIASSFFHLLFERQQEVQIVLKDSILLAFEAKTCRLF